MKLSRREMLATAPLGLAATSAHGLTLSDPIDISPTPFADRLGVAQTSIEAAMRRLDRFVPRPAALLQGRTAGNGGAAFDLVVTRGEVTGGGRWRWEGGVSELQLDRAIGISSSAATLAWLDRRFRYVAGCAFGGITLLVFGNLRTTIGVLARGQHVNGAPGHLIVEA